MIRGAECGCIWQGVKGVERDVGEGVHVVRRGADVGEESVGRVIKVWIRWGRV